VPVKNTQLYKKRRGRERGYMGNQEKRGERSVEMDQQV
jgi:hypothetical protein